MEGTAVQKRADIALALRWQLEDIYPGDAAWEADFAAAQAQIEAMPAVEAALEPAAGSILSALEAVYALEKRVSRLYPYARMRRDEDNRVASAQAMADRAQTLSARMSAATAFLSPALLSMPETLIESCANDPAFREYDRVLKTALRNRPHTLSKEMETLLSAESEVGQSFTTIFTMMTDADLTFPKVNDESGNPVEFTEARLFLFLRSRDGRVRRDAYENLMNTYGKFGNTFASIYAGSIKNGVFNTRARHFGSAIEASLFESEIPLAVYGALQSAVGERLPALNRYLKTKQKALGLDALHLWDLYADTTKDFKMELSYDEAYAVVLDALSPLGEDYVSVIRAAKDRRWVDALENEGKSSGAYSWGVYGVHPFVLMNFDNTFDSASTLAHELGHAMHSYYSESAQPYPKADYTLFAAEVASTVNEILLSSHMLDKHKGRATRQSLLGSLLEHFRTTVFRQTLFATFERDAHAMYERGEALTKDALCELYIGIYQRFYGESCVIDDIVRYEWMRIPHFYRAFYVYAYATGFSAAVCIARRILREGAPAAEGYRKFLSSGGALPPIEALKLAGVDMATPRPVREALDWFEELLGEFEKIC